VRCGEHRTTPATGYAAAVSWLTRTGRRQLRTRLPPALVQRRETLRLQPIKEFDTLIENHWDSILAWHKNHLSNGPLFGPGSYCKPVPESNRNKTR
jgi:hypothetical protein